MIIKWHRPIRAVRELDGEQVFAEKWYQMMMNTDADHDTASMLESILSNFGKPTCRHSQVIASVVTWFGTNCGGCFLMEARKLASKDVLRFPFLAQWSIQNRRNAYINGGSRTLEHCIADRIEPNSFYVSGQSLIFDGAVSTQDYEAVECLMCWLSTGDGERFLSSCEREIEARRLKLSEQSRKLLGIN